jgi:type I restriction enzyme S subunit
VAPIAELATKVGSGATPKGGQSAYQITGTPLIRSMNVVFFGFKEEGLAYINDDQAQLLSNAEVRQGDVLLNITGASIGRVTAAPDWSEGARVNQHVCIIRPSGCLLQSYLSAYLSSPAIQSLIIDENYGVTRQALTKQQVLELEIPVPPLNEQHRIAAKLDTALVADDACRQRLDGVEALLKRFRQAVLAAATSGELTREWRGERGESDWDTNSFGNCGAVTGGITKNSSRLSMPLQKSYLRVANVYRNRIDLDDISTIGITEAEYGKTVLRPGDLLIVEGNGSLQQVGRVAIWEESDLDCVHQNHLIRWRTHEMRPKWALYWLMSPVGRELLEQRAKSTTGLHTLSVSKVSGIPIPVPSIAEQEEIIVPVQGVRRSTKTLLRGALLAVREI